MGKLDPAGFDTWAGLFAPTYCLDRDGLEIEREEMFEHEQSFALHDAADASIGVDTAHLGNARLFRVRSTGHTVRLHEPDHVSVLIIRRGRMVVETGPETFSAGQGDMLLFTPNRRTTHVLRGGAGQFEAQCALVRVDGLAGERPRCRAAPIERMFKRTHCSPRARILGRLLDDLFVEGSDPSSILAASVRARDAADVLICEILGALLREDEDGASGAKRPSRRDHGLVRQAEEVIRERYREAISTRDLAAILGVSARRLQVAFENVSEGTPLGMLRRIRLERVREGLAAAREGDSITTIAIECGFGHLGRFARIYAETFGEMPSDTLRRLRT